MRRAQLGHDADRAAVRGGGRAGLRLLRRRLQGLHHAGPAHRTVSIYLTDPCLKVIQMTTDRLVLVRTRRNTYLVLNIPSYLFQ